MKALGLLLFVSYAVLITVLSLQPAGAVSTGSWDKLAHLLAYGGFVVLAAGLVSRRRQYLYLCLSIVAYSGLMEVGQLWVPGRSASLLDLLANAAGVLLGMIAVRILLRLKRSFLPPGDN